MAKATLTPPSRKVTVLFLKVLHTQLILALAVLVQFASGVVYMKVVRRWASWGSPHYPSAELFAGCLQVTSTALYLVVAIGGWAYWILPLICVGLLISIPSLWWGAFFFATRCLLKVDGVQRLKLSSWKPNEPCEVRFERGKPWICATVIRYETEYDKGKYTSPLSVTIEEGEHTGNRFEVRSADLLRESPREARATKEAAC